MRMAPLLGTVASLVDEHYWLPLFGRSDLAPTDRAATAAVIERKPTPCWTLFTEAHVRADGRLSACCLDASDRFVRADLNRPVLHPPGMARLFERCERRICGAT